MALQVALHHQTRYRYGRAVALGPQTIQLRPSPAARTPILSYSLRVTPSEHSLNWQFDALGNHVARVFIPGTTQEFVTEVDLVADLTPINPFAFMLEPGCEIFPFTYSPELTRNLEPYRTLGQAGPLLRTFLRDLASPPQPTVGFLVSLTQRVCNAVAYTTRLEHGVQTWEHTLERRSGSCRDSAWLLVAICRQLGLAARFVSGYLIQLADDQLPAGPQQDRADLHAWAEVFLPGAGWIGLDATSGLLTAENHIPLAAAPAPEQTAPVSGTVEPSTVDFTFSMTVRRIEDLPSLARPYTDQQWTAIRAVAHHIDADLLAHDVRLTMGGEPTYVGIDDTESLQWSFAALGPIKRQRGLELIRALRERTAPGGLLHLGQGKWYPGEELPRWAFFCIARTDGVPVWQDASLFAREDLPSSFTNADALTFLTALTRRLGVTADNILPAIEPFLDDPASAIPTGYVLPLRRRQPDGRLTWSSQLWFPRPASLVLSPGDSPVGYRIPVEAMPWVAPDNLLYELETGTIGDLSAGPIKLPAHPARHPERFALNPTPDPLPAIPADAEGTSLLIRPSLCVQVRDAASTSFSPSSPSSPTTSTSSPPSRKPPSTSPNPSGSKATPRPTTRACAPGDSPPTPASSKSTSRPRPTGTTSKPSTSSSPKKPNSIASSPQSSATTAPHLATGGGSHITLGGPSVPESPILRRPDLLRSMISFWQNHPSLSYMFAGMYVGPTSQYPRVDEARTDALYELELSFSQLPPDDCPPYILDGLFRNLLVDVSGNTHRAEFCIDKLFPPEGAGLRAGLLELRAFEMAPHVRMGLLQMLLVRALVAVFWRQPFTGELLRWGATLHDRFMLPHFLEQDFAEVLDHLNRSSYKFDPAWFAPHIEFRFPRIGTATADGITLELRQALEPWNVLAEETTSSGTGRSVDSSLERIQIKLTGAHSSPAVIVVAPATAATSPCTPPALPGESLAGIRYRARRLNPPRCTPPSRFTPR